MTFLTRAEAAEKISTIIKKEKPIKTGIKLPIRKGETFSVYRIPIDYLVPNFLNDRISWRILEYQEENKRELSAENPDDVEHVYTLIERDSPHDNVKTLNDIAEKGQQREGIITQDGIIIDGNRRATLIRRLFKGEAASKGKNIEDFRFFDAIVLNEYIDDKERVALETSIQIGEDKKVEYNRICLYLKVANLTKYGYNTAQIASYMNCKEKDVEEKKEVFRMMQQYLRAIGKPNHYTLLDGLEDHFLNTRTVFRKLENETYQTDGWEYDYIDIGEFKQVCYDYMRAKFEGKKFRDILVGKPNKSNGVFIKESVWKNFYKKHEEILDKYNPQNEADWERLGKKQFASNLKDASNNLAEVLKEKDITSLVNTIQNKVHSLLELLNSNNQLATNELNILKQVNADISKIIKGSE